MQIAKSKRFRPAKGPRRCRVRNRILAKKWSSERVSGEVDRNAVAIYNRRQRLNCTVERTRDANGKMHMKVTRTWWKHPAQ